MAHLVGNRVAQEPGNRDHIRTRNILDPVVKDDCVRPDTGERKGVSVLLNFWGTSCVPCREEMPDMEKLHREFQSKGLIILAVSDDEPKDLDKFLATKNYTFPVLLDHERKTFDEFDVTGVPKTFVYDRDGHLVAQAIDKCRGA